MEAVKKYSLWGIFISIISIFIMSHNANAVDFTYNLNDYELVYNSNFPTQYCYYSASTPSSSSGQCILNSTNGTTFYGLATDSLSHKKYDLVEFYIGVSSPVKFDAFGNLGMYFLNYGTSVGDWRIINFEEVVDNSTPVLSDNTNITCRHYFDSNGDWYDCSGLSGNSYNSVQFSQLYRVSATALANGNGPIGIVSSSSFPMATCKTLNDDCRIRMFGIRRWEFKGSEENREQEEKTQEAVDASETAGGSSSQNAQTGTTGLISAIGSAVNVISSASPTNCRINGNMGNLDMGMIDLCANPAPTFVQTIGSLILILMCVPLAISLFNRFIALFRSFQS